MTVINIRILEWLGRVVRTDRGKAAKTLLEGKTRKRGGKGRRPKLRWLDDVKFDFRNMGLKR